MSFGVEVHAEGGSVQFSSENPVYVCIYSSTNVRRGSYIGGRADDIVFVTALVSDPNGNERRILAFRSVKHLVLPPDDFGIEVFNSDGLLTYSSKYYPLVLSPNNGGTPSVEWNMFSYIGADTKGWGTWFPDYYPLTFFDFSHIPDNYTLGIVSIT